MAADDLLSLVLPLPTLCQARCFNLSVVAEATYVENRLACWVVTTLFSCLSRVLTNGVW